MLWLYACWNGKEFFFSLALSNGRSKNGAAAAAAAFSKRFISIIPSLFILGIYIQQQRPTQKIPTYFQAFPPLTGWLTTCIRMRNEQQRGNNYRMWCIIYTALKNDCFPSGVVMNWWWKFHFSRIWDTVGSFFRKSFTMYNITLVIKQNQQFHASVQCNGTSKTLWDSTAETLWNQAVVR